MRIANVVRLFFGIGIVFANAVQAAAWKSCNDKAVGPKSPPIAFALDGCSIVADGSTASGTAAINALNELHTYVGLGQIGSTTSDKACRIKHGDGRSDVAYVPPGQIDGNLGLTITKTDGCTWSWSEEHIVESDVMVLSTLDFSQPNESFVGTVPSAPGLGRAIILHESGHAVGLAHTTGFSMMRNGMGARVPYMGGEYANAGHVLFTADDVLGLRNVYRAPGDYPNLYVSAQWWDTTSKQDVIRDTNVDPSTDASLSNPITLCPGQPLPMMTTAGNQSTFSRHTILRIYADTPGQCSSLDGVGTELARFSVSVNAYSTFSFPVNAVIPATIPRNVPLNVFTALNVGGTPKDEKRGYDDCARSAINLVVRDVMTCGR